MTRAQSRLTGAGGREPRPVRFMLALGLFFLSGATGLIYEIAWFRRLQLVFGVSIFAIGAVVSAFMLGLAMGSGWAGTTRWLRSRPLLAYGLLEAGIGAYALLFPALVVGVEHLYSSFFGLIGGHFLWLSALRFALSLLLLLPATFGMGATLPTLVRAVAPARAEVGRKAGWLYAVNTFGAAVGTLAAAFFMLEHLGIRGTIWLGAALNFLIAGTAFVFSPKLTETAGKAGQPQEQTPHKAADAPGLREYQAIGVVTLAGLISMAGEVVWTRALVFYVHNTTYAFSAILAVYLLGLAAGAGVAGRLSGGRRAVQWLCWTLVGICFGSVLAIAAYRHLPWLIRPLLGETLAPALAALPDRSFWVVRTWVTALSSIFLQAGAVLFVPAFLFGMVFPLAVGTVQAKAASPSLLIGRLYAMNTLGSVAGTILGSFLLVPLLGTRGALVLLACLSAPAAWLVLNRAAAASRMCRVTAGLLALGLIGGLWLAAPQGFYREMFASRFGKVLWFSEGISETIAICEHSDRSAWIHYSDGRGASGTTSFRGGWLYAHVPLLLHPAPRSALVICFGTGNTLGAASLHPLERVDGVELSSEVVKASSFFRESNHNVARNPGVRIIVEDGRNYLLGSQVRYDVITEEPPLVHTAGVVNLYSRDFYRLCARRLSDTGIMAVWLATWELEERDVRMLVRAFVEVFPCVSAWDSKHLGEWLLIGSKRPLSIDPEGLARRMGEPKLSQDLARIGVRTPAELLALYVKGEEFLKKFSQDVPPVTDDRSVVDYTTPRRARANFGLGEWLTGGLHVAGVGPNGLVSELRVRDFDGIYTHRDAVEPLLTNASAPLLEEIKARRGELEIEAGRKLAWNLMASASDYFEIGQPEKSFETLDWGLEVVGTVASADLLVMKARLCAESGLMPEARELLTRAFAIDPKHAEGLKLAAKINPL